MAETSTPHFSVDWFSPVIPLWEELVTHLPARHKFLEIGSFEGRSACWMLENALAEDGELYCVDTWAGSPEFHTLSPDIVAGSHQRFIENTRLARRGAQRIRIFRNTSTRALADLIVSGAREAFDLIYIDGSHFAVDTITDACMAWPLLKLGGILIFDDYIWSLHAPVHARPKIAIDAFTLIFHEQLEHMACGQQYAVKKK